MFRDLHCFIWFGQSSAGFCRCRGLRTKAITKRENKNSSLWSTKLSAKLYFSVVYKSCWVLARTTLYVVWFSDQLTRSVGRLFMSCQPTSNFKSLEQLVFVYTKLDPGERYICLLFLLLLLFNVGFASLPRQCTHLPGLGFRRGSYRCECKKGYYFPFSNTSARYYNGTVIEEEYEKKLLVSANFQNSFNLLWFFFLDYI